MVHTTLSSPIPFTLSATDVIESSHTVPSVTTIPSTLIGTDMTESSHPVDVEHVEVDEDDVPLARRRPKRTIKAPPCGTH